MTLMYDILQNEKDTLAQQEKPHRLPLWQGCSAMYLHVEAKNHTRHVPSNYLPRHFFASDIMPRFKCKIKQGMCIVIAFQARLSMSILEKIESAIANIVIKVSK